MLDYEMLHDRDPKRPVMLSVLCVLTWLGAAIELISFRGLREAPLENTYETFLLISVLCSIAAVAGAIFMWNLKRAGFYLYTAAQQIQVAIIVALFFSGSMSFFGGIATQVLIKITFIVLYSRFLKIFR